MLSVSNSSVANDRKSNLKGLNRQRVWVPYQPQLLEGSRRGNLPEKLHQSSPGAHFLPSGFCVTPCEHHLPDFKNGLQQFVKIIKRLWGDFSKNGSHSLQRRRSLLLWLLMNPGVYLPLASTGSHVLSWTNHCRRLFPSLAWVSQSGCVPGDGCGVNPSKLCGWKWRGMDFPKGEKSKKECKKTRKEGRREGGKERETEREKGRKEENQRTKVCEKWGQILKRPPPDGHHNDRMSKHVTLSCLIGGYWTGEILSFLVASTMSHKISFSPSRELSPPLGSSGWRKLHHAFD